MHDSSSHFSFLFDVMSVKNWLKASSGQIKHLSNLNISLNSHNGLIRDSQKPGSIFDAPLHSSKMMISSIHSASFILDTDFFEVLVRQVKWQLDQWAAMYITVREWNCSDSPSTAVACTNNLYPIDRAPPQISQCVKKIVKRHFTGERVRSRHFLDVCRVCYPDLNHWNLWLWENFKHLVSPDKSRTLPDVKDSVSRHMSIFSSTYFAQL